MPNENDKICCLLVGEDDWTKGKYIQEIKTAYLTAGNEMMNYFEFKDKDITASKLADVSETLPFFAEKKVIYIKDTGFFKAGKKEETEAFEEYVKNFPDYVVLLIDEKEVDKRSKLYKTISTHYKVHVFDYPGEEAVYKMLQTQTAKLNVSIETSVLQHFIRNMPEDIAYIMAEFEKLSCYAGSGKVTKKMIETVCSFPLEKRVFELVKRIASKNAAGAFEIYHTLIQAKESPIGILVLIARQYRVMLQVKYLLKNNTPAKEIAAEVKLPFFALKELTEQVQKYTFKQLEEILTKCLETDKDIKSGKMDSTKRVEVLIMECLN